MNFIYYRRIFGRIRILEKSAVSARERRRMRERQVNLHRWGKQKSYIWIPFLQVSWRLLCSCMQCRDGSLDDVPLKSDPCHNNKYMKILIIFPSNKTFRQHQRVKIKSCLLSIVTTKLKWLIIYNVLCMILFFYETKGTCIPKTK